MPVTTIGNISLPESAPIHAGHEHHRTLKGGLGSRPGGNLIEGWPLEAENGDESLAARIRSGVGQEFEKQPWLMMALAGGLGIALGALFFRR